MTREEFKKSLLGTKVATNGKEIELQKTLFALGFAWNVGENNLMTAYCPYMFIDDRYCITWTWNDDSFSRDNSKEITADYILNTIIEEDEMTTGDKAILEKCGIHYENDTLEKEIALRVITETRKQFKEYLEKKRTEYLAVANGNSENCGMDYAACINEIINEHFEQEG